jgi:guanylate kinase
MLGLAGPSGGGKGTIKALLLTFPELFTFSVSCNTRPLAEDEVQGVDYDSVTREEFERRIAADYFEEWEEINGDYYGTPKSEIERAKTEGKVLLFDIDVKGMRKLKGIFGKQFLAVFIDSGNDPSLYERRIRERKRSSDTEEKILRRVARIPEELPIGRDNADIVLENKGTRDQLLRLAEDTLIGKIFKVAKSTKQ